MSDTSATDLAVRIHAVETEINSVKKAIRAGARARLLILLLLIAFVVGVGLLFYQLVERVKSRDFQQEVLTLAQKHLENNSDEYAAEMQKLVENATPVITKALKDRAERDADRYTDVVTQERDKLVKNMRPKLNRLVQARYKSGMQGLEDALAQELPEAKDPVVQKRVRESVELAMNNLVDEYYLDEMEAQVRLADIRWKGFPAAEAPGAEDASAMNQLIGCFLEMLTRQLSRNHLGK